MEETLVDGDIVLQPVGGRLEAAILSQTDDKLCVRCPWCRAIEYHTFNGRNSWYSCHWSKSRLYYLKPQSTTTLTGAKVTRRTSPAAVNVRPSTVVVKKQSVTIDKLKVALPPILQVRPAQTAQASTSSKQPDPAAQASSGALLKDATVPVETLSGLFRTTPASIFLNCELSKRIRHLRIEETANVGGLNRNGDFRTMAALHRGEPYEDLLALSGWTPAFTNAIPGLLDAVHWSHRVEKLMEHIGYVPIPHKSKPHKDSGWFACHAEKQLLAYFVQHHVNMPESLSGPSLSYPGQDAYQQRRLAESSTLEDPTPRRVLEFLRPALRPKLVEARSFVSQEVCTDCVRFIKKINETFGIKITYEVRQVTLDE